MTVTNLVHGLLASRLMDEAKRATLAEFLNSPTILDKVASVLNMCMAGLKLWIWPAEGMTIEMCRYLNSKYKAFTDMEIIDALLL
ncbi:hypothetical protein H0H87_000403, partial [Tephrocybe sp. NHM501043]